VLHILHPEHALLNSHLNKKSREVICIPAMLLSRTLWLAALLASSSANCGLKPVKFHSQRNTGFAVNSAPLAQHSAKFEADCIRRCANNDACISGFWKSDVTGINCILFGFPFFAGCQRTESCTLHFVRGENRLAIVLQLRKVDYDFLNSITAHCPAIKHAFRNR
jgi:hypothetical protein